MVFRKVVRGEVRDVNNNLMKFDLGGHGLNEIRLNISFFQLPLPYIGATQRKSIFSITRK